jgi:hypothetical protein
MYVAHYHMVCAGWMSSAVESAPFSTVVCRQVDASSRVASRIFRNAARSFDRGFERCG